MLYEQKVQLKKKSPLSVRQSISVFQNMEIKMNNLLSHMLIMSRMEKLHGTQSQLYYSILHLLGYI